MLVKCNIAYEEASSVRMEHKRNTSLLPVNLPTITPQYANAADRVRRTVGGDDNDEHD